MTHGLLQCFRSYLEATKTLQDSQTKQRKDRTPLSLVRRLKIKNEYMHQRRQDGDDQIIRAIDAILLFLTVRVTVKQ